MKQWIMAGTALVFLAASGAVLARASATNDDPAYQNLPFKLRRHCMAYKEEHKDMSGRYYIGECVFQMDFSSQPTEPVNIIPLYNAYASRNQNFFPKFDPKLCSLNVRRDRFNFSTYNPDWSTVNNNYINYEKVADAQGNDFSLQITIPDSMDTGVNHIITAEFVCLGKSPEQIAKENAAAAKQAKAAASTKSATTTGQPKS